MQKVKIIFSVGRCIYMYNCIFVHGKKRKSKITISSPVWPIFKQSFFYMDEEHIIKVVNFVQKRPIFAVFRPDLTEKESFYILDDVFKGAVFFSSISPAENRFSFFYLGPSQMWRGVKVNHYDGGSNSDLVCYWLFLNFSYYTYS